MNPEDGFALLRDPANWTLRMPRAEASVTIASPRRTWVPRAFAIAVSAAVLVIAVGVGFAVRGLEEARPPVAAAPASSLPGRGAGGVAEPPAPTGSAPPTVGTLPKLNDDLVDRLRTEGNIALSDGTDLDAADAPVAQVVDHGKERPIRASAGESTFSTDTDYLNDQTADPNGRTTEVNGSPVIAVAYENVPAGHCGPFLAGVAQSCPAVLPGTSPSTIETYVTVVRLYDASGARILWQESFGDVPAAAAAETGAFGIPVPSPALLSELSDTSRITVRDVRPVTDASSVPRQRVPSSTDSARNLPSAMAIATVTAYHYGRTVQGKFVRTIDDRQVLVVVYDDVPGNPIGGPMSETSSPEQNRVRGTSIRFLDIDAPHEMLYAVVF